jgi:ABC-type sugar transport system ATPase subunit
MQRVAIGRAIVREPRLFLMDEPLSNLDAKLRIQMRGEIRDLQKQLGITTIYVTHDQEEALVISDRIAVMKSARIQQVGRPWEIYKSPVNAFVASFVGAMNFVPADAVGAVATALGVRAGGREKVTLAFRPEELSLVAAGAQPPAGQAGAPVVRLPGSLRKCTFTGALLSYTVDCGGTLLAVERHRPGLGDLLAEGARVEVVVPPEAILTFDAQTGERL